jgi:hypothetical protein
MYCAIKHFHSAPLFADKHLRLVPPEPVTFQIGSESFSVVTQFTVSTGKTVNFFEECHWSHACKCFQRSECVNPNSILECKVAVRNQSTLRGEVIEVVEDCQPACRSSREDNIDPPERIASVAAPIPIVVCVSR